MPSQTINQHTTPFPAKEKIRKWRQKEEMATQLGAMPGLPKDPGLIPHTKLTAYKHL